MTGLTTAALFCVRLIREFQRGEPVQAIDTFTDRFYGSEYSITPFTPHRIGCLPSEHLDVPADYRERIVDLMGHRGRKTGHELNSFAFTL